MSFNPDKAEELEEHFEDAELSFLTDTIERRVKSLRAQVISDAFKELVKFAKEERKQLVEAMKKEVVGAMKEELATATASSIEEIKASTGNITKGAGDTHQRIESLVKRLETAFATRPKNEVKLGPLHSAIANLHAHISRAEEQRCTEHEAAMEEIRKNKPQAPQKPSYVFTVERDDYGRIKNIRAD